MNNKTEQTGWERWYPLTYPGFYKRDLSECPSLCYEHCRLDVSLLRGECIGLHAVSEEENAFFSLTDEKGNILEQGETVPETIRIPETALHLYLNNYYAQNPDFYLSVPSAKFRKPNGFLFYEDFTNEAVLDANDFFGTIPAKDCTRHGLLLPRGIENALVIHKSTALDDWCLTAEVTAPEGDEVICLGTRITQDRPCKHASLCCVDLRADELYLYRGCTGNEMPEEIVQRISISGLIGKGEFTMRLERVDSAIRASVINPATGEEISVTQELEQEENPPISIVGACRAGKMFDSPQIFALSGSPVLRRFYGAAKVFPKVIFFGDSLTQGAHNLPENGWAQMCAAKIGNSLCSGRGSGDIWSCLNQVRTMLPALRPKAMVVTIGVNNRNNTVSTETVRGLYEKFIRMAEHQGVILILNCISICPREHIAETNRILCSLGTLKSRFDLALVENNEEGGAQIPGYYAADNTHLNAEGNRKLFQYFMRDFSWLQNL